MSSVYRAICIAHTPVLVPSDGMPDLEAAIITAKGQGHTGCQLLVGRWSGGLVEIGCPPDGHSYGCHPGGIVWVGAVWLRIAALALETDAPQVHSAIEKVPACFSVDRLKLLRPLLVGS